MGLERLHVNGAQQKQLFDFYHISHLFWGATLCTTFGLMRTAGSWILPLFILLLVPWTLRVAFVLSYKQRGTYERPTPLGMSVSRQTTIPGQIVYLAMHSVA